MFFRQIYEEGLAQASYIVASPDSQTALVVDPRRDIDVYLDIARENDFTITGVTETHVHADFLSGARDLAAATGATLYFSGEGGPDWTYATTAGVDLRTVRDGDVIRVGNVTVRVFHVPGHTPEHLMFCIGEDASSSTPMIALTGDFVFVGDVGRPDLLESAVGVAGSAQLGARAMFASLRDKFCSLPDFVQIWPGHGAGSACGKALGAVPASTVGYEKLTAWWAPFVRSGDEGGFVRELLDGQPDAPTYFARMKRLNRDGAPRMRELPKIEQLDTRTLRAALEGGALLIDTRDRATFKAGHLHGALFVADEPTFSTRCAWFVPEGRRVVLLADPRHVDALVRALVRVGIDDIDGFVVPGGAAVGSVSQHEPQRSVDVIEARRQWAGDGALLLDVRSSSEYRHGHVPGALHIPTGKLVGALGSVPRDRPLFVYCAGGSRSVSAASVLSAAGFDAVADVSGGFDAWEEAGNPVETGIPAGAFAHTKANA